MNTIYKTIFQVSLSSWLDELCLQGDQNSEYVVFPSVTDIHPSQDHLFEYNDHINSLKLCLQETWSQYAGFLVYSFLGVCVCVSNNIM